MQSSSSVTTPTTPMSSMIPASHQLNSSSPFADSGIGLNIMSSANRLMLNNNNNSVEVDDDVFIVENSKSLFYIIFFKCANSKKLIYTYN